MESEILTITNSRNIEEFKRLENQAYQCTLACTVSSSQLILALTFFNIHLVENSVACH